jgi:hypothetical protein
VNDSAFHALTLLREYGLAGVLAWLFWWTLRRMMLSHDETVQKLTTELSRQAESARASGERFTQAVESHMNSVLRALNRFDGDLSKHTEQQQRWIDRLLSVLERTAGALAKGGE